jgi:GntR family transcriptional regulator
VRDGDSACGDTADEAQRSQPLYRRIAGDIRQQILRGDLLPGQALPSEHDLVSRYGVARGTVRQALFALRADGTVSGSRGKPLSVRGPHMTQPLSELISFSSWVEAQGRKPSAKVVEYAQGEALEDEAAALGLPQGGVVYRLLRLRLVDDRPLMIERATFPPHVGVLVAEVDLDNKSIYAELGRQGIVFASARHVIGAMGASKVDADLLGVPVRTPLLRIRRRAFSHTGVALEWSEDRYLADQVDFAVENSATAPGVSRHMV